MSEGKLSLSSFNAALDEGADDVKTFTNLLPDDVNLESLPSGLARLCVQEKAPKCLAALLERYPHYPVNEGTRKEKATALHLAAAFCPQETCRYIITCNGGDTDGCEPFKGFMAGNMIDTLLKASADGTRKDKDGNTPFRLFCKLRSLSGWEQMLLPFGDKHRRIKEDLERVAKVLREAEGKKPKRTAKEPSTAASSKKKARAK